jgi:PAS domain S-box-containing protein
VVNQQTDRFLQLVFDSIEDYAVMVMNLDGTVISCNPGVEKLLGYRANELIGKTSDVIFTDEDRDAGSPTTEMETALATGRAFDDRWHVRKDGSRVWVNGIMTDLRDPGGEPIGFVKVMRDRTDELMVQTSLRDSEARYRSLLDDVLDVFDVGVFILDPRFDVIWINRAAERYFGISRERAVGRNKSELRPLLARQVVEPGDFVERLRAAQEHNTFEERFEVHLRGNEEREECWLEHRSQPILSGPFAGGRIERYYDITARKRASHELAAARDGLEAQIRERTADLTALNEELDSFNYSVSHDLRAPLRGLTGFSQILLADYRDQIDETGRHYLERLSAAAERMGELIDALLALSRVSRSDLRIEDLDLSAIAERAAAALRESEPKREVDLVLEPGVRARGDADLLYLALYNLLANAWTFTRDEPEACIEFGVNRSPEGDAYFLRDNGVGFDMRFADKLFVPFQRLHSPNSYSGMGIGLAAVQRIVHRHGGKVWGEGEVGGGATFYFTLQPNGG